MAPPFRPKFSPYFGPGQRRRFAGLALHRLSPRAFRGQRIGQVLMRANSHRWRPRPRSPRPAARRDAGLDHRFGPPRDERMPPGKILAPRHEPIGASSEAAISGVRARSGESWMQSGTCVCDLCSRRSGSSICRAGGTDIGGVDGAVILVLQLDEAAAATAVAQALPFLARSSRRASCAARKAPKGAHGRPSTGHAALWPSRDG